MHDGRTRSSDFNKVAVAVDVAIAIVAIRSDLRQARLGVMPVAVS